MAGLIGNHGREHVHRLDCWCRPTVYLYCQYCDGYGETSQTCFMCKGAHVFQMIASDRARLQELIDADGDRPPLFVVHMNGSADGLAIELTSHLILGRSPEDSDDDDDDGDDTDEPEPAEPWARDPESWKK